MALAIELQANAAATAWTDITAYVAIETIRFGGRAANGESEQCGFNLEDDAAAITLPAHRIVRATEDATTPATVIGWGRIQSVDIGRGKLFSGDARDFDVQLTDPNGELRGIAFAKYTRGAETPYHRAKNALTTFCNGTWRASTVLDHTTYIPGTDFADDMPKKAYGPGRLEDVLSDVASTHGLTYFVTCDQEVFFGLPTSIAYASTIAISDAGDDDGETIFAPEWEGTANSSDGDQVISEVLATYATSKIIDVRRLAVEAAHDRWVDIINVDSTSKLAATNKANSTLDLHATEESSIRCQLTLRADQVDLIRHGQTLAFRAAAAGILSPQTFRIASLVWEWAGPDRYIAHLELNFPRKVAGTIDHTPAGPPNEPFQPDVTSYCDVVAADGATNLWALDEATGPAIDSLGAEDGTYNDLNSDQTRHVTGPSISCATGAVQTTGLGTPGSNVSIDDLGIGFPAGNSDRTVEWWFRYGTAFLGTAGVIYYGTGGFTSFRIDLGADGPVVAVGGAPNVGTLSGLIDASAVDGNWHHEAVTYEGATRTVKVYHDGVLQWTDTFPGDVGTVLGTTAAIAVAPPLQTYGQCLTAIYPLVLTADQIANHALGDAAVPPAGASSDPRRGQPVGPESAVSDGATTLYTANFPYAPNSLVVKIGPIGAQITVEVTEVDPEAGTFQLPFAPADGILITWTYIGAGGDATGATHGPPPAPSGDDGTIPPPVGPGSSIPGTVPGTGGVYTQPSAEVDAVESPDGSRTDFTFWPFIPGTAIARLNHLDQRPVTDFSELSPAGGTLRFVGAPYADDTVTARLMPASAIDVNPSDVVTLPSSTTSEQMRNALVDMTKRAILLGDGTWTDMQLSYWNADRTGRPLVVEPVNPGMVTFDGTGAGGNGSIYLGRGGGVCRWVTIRGIIFDTWDIGSTGIVMPMNSSHVFLDGLVANNVTGTPSQSHFIYVSVDTGVGSSDLRIANPILNGTDKTLSLVQTYHEPGFHRLTIVGGEAHKAYVGLLAYGPGDGFVADGILFDDCGKSVEVRDDGHGAITGIIQNCTATGSDSDREIGSAVTDDPSNSWDR